MEPVPEASRPTAAPASASPGPVFTADPAQGRRYTTARLVRSTDVTPDGRLRFDALARYLQEAAEDDVADTGWDAPYDWRLRRCEVAITATRATATRSACGRSARRPARAGPSGPPPWPGRAAT